MTYEYLCDGQRIGTHNSDIQCTSSYATMHSWSLYTVVRTSFQYEDRIASGDPSRTVLFPLLISENITH